MAHTIVAYGFIDQQYPVQGQICVVQVHDHLTNTDKFRLRFLPQPQFGNNEVADVQETARRGAKLPKNAGETLIKEIGGIPDVPIPL